MHVVEGGGGDGPSTMQREAIGDLSTHEAGVHANSDGKEGRVDEWTSLMIAYLPGPAATLPTHHYHVSLDCTSLCWIMVFLAYTLVRLGVSVPISSIYFNTPP